MNKLDQLSDLLTQRGIEHENDGRYVYAKKCRIMEYAVARDGRPKHLNEPIMGLMMKVFDLTPEQIARILEVIA